MISRIQFLLSRSLVAAHSIVLLSCLVLSAACSSSEQGLATPPVEPVSEQARGVESTEEQSTMPVAVLAEPAPEALLVGETPDAMRPDDTSSRELTEGTACQAVTSEAEESLRPMDIVVVIDNSGSMTAEIASVERNINVNFAAILEASGIDYRVLMVTGYRAGPQPAPQDLPGRGQGGGDNRVCVGPPLGPSACLGRTPADIPHNGERFFHFDQPIGSTDGPCLMLQTLKSAPIASGGGGRRGRAPTRADDPLSQAGWAAHLRPDAFKAFIMIGDDTVECQVPGLDYQRTSAEDSALAFDELLRASAPELFGTSAETRLYAWHSIVGLAPKAQDAVYEPDDAVVTQLCESAEEPGEPHQFLSRLTGGLRYPVCNVDGYDAVFKRIAGEIVEGAALPCSWEIPPPPTGKAFDKDRVNLQYLPGDGTPAPELGRVAGADACKSALGWYYDDAAEPTTVHACPAACAQLTDDRGGRIDLLFGCATTTPKLK